MSILQKITDYKRQEVEAKKQTIPVEILRSALYFERKTISLSKALKTSKTGIIAEHKRRSPSKSVINDKVALPEVVLGYQEAGVSGISVLTDTRFFGGSLDDLALARSLVNIPLLRKEFIIDPYQIYEAKAYGADAILLIAACLTTQEMEDLVATAKQLDLEILLEVHSEAELKASINVATDLIGVNNRNLKTFEVSLETSTSLASLIPDPIVKVSESGISNPEAIAHLKEFGYEGFLVGEHFMRSSMPGQAAKEFISQL